MSLSLPGPLVSTAWLAEHLDAPGLVVLDGSFKLPGILPSAAEDYAARHIPGARFFDIDHIADQASPLPHMLPAPEDFERFAAELGISNDDAIVVYDTPGLMSAGRVWWTFRVFGHTRIAVVDGGLRQWLAEGRSVTDAVPAVAPGHFRAAFDAARVRSKAQLIDNLSTAAEQVVDARSATRFSAEEKEARPGLRSGHIPGSRNLPFVELSDATTGRLKGPEDIRAAFEAAGIDLSNPVVTSCGSGVTAGALAFGLHLIGKQDVALYDGSWAEWGREGETPVTIGPA